MSKQDDDYDEYGDEDFEAYDDDFDEPEEVAPPKASAAPAPIPSRPPVHHHGSGSGSGNSSKAEMDALRRSVENENRTALAHATERSMSTTPGAGGSRGASPSTGLRSDSKGYHSTSASTSSGGHGHADGGAHAQADAKRGSGAGAGAGGSKGTSGGGGGGAFSMDFSASLNVGSRGGSSSSNPRIKRLQRLRGLLPAPRNSSGSGAASEAQQCVFDMQEESFNNQLNIQPITPFDLYHRILRIQPTSAAPIKQCGVPAEEDVRDVEVMTESIAINDASVQFCYSDDTDLLNTIECVRGMKREQKQRQKRGEEGAAERLADYVSRVKCDAAAIMAGGLSSLEAGGLPMGKCIGGSSGVGGSRGGGTGTGTGTGSGVGGGGSGIGGSSNPLESMLRGGSTQLSTFLQHASDVVEGLLVEEGRGRAGGRAGGYEGGDWGDGADEGKSGGGQSSGGTSVSIVRSKDAADDSSRPPLPSWISVVPTTTTPSALFSARTPAWRRCGGPTASASASSGILRLLQQRRTSVVRFSPLTPNLLIAVHPYDYDACAAAGAGAGGKSKKGRDKDGDVGEFKPYKGLFSIWDVNAAEAPLFVLEAPGQPTHATFSSSQVHIIAACTEDGVVHAWDLREAASNHRDRVSQQLGISSGIRKPCYSSNSSSSKGTAGGGGGSGLEKRAGRLSLSAVLDGSSDAADHCSSILHIEAVGGCLDTKANATATGFVGLGGGSGGDGDGHFNTSVSQFVTVDEFGSVYLWMTMEVNNNQASSASGSDGKGSGSNSDQGGSESAVSMVSSVDDFGMPPWSKVKLSISRKVEVNWFGSSSHTVGSGSGSSAGAGAAIGGSGLFRSTHAVIATVPGESASSFLYCADFAGAAGASRTDGADSFGLSSSSSGSGGSSGRGRGDILRLSRLGQATAPVYYSRLRDAVAVGGAGAGGGAGAVSSKQAEQQEMLRKLSSHYIAPVTCMSVTMMRVASDNTTTTKGVAAGDPSESKDGDADGGKDGDEPTPAASAAAPTSSTSTTVCYILAGREDGCIDLYDMRVSVPILTWRPVDFVKHDGGGAGRGGGAPTTVAAFLSSASTSSFPIVSVKWVTHTSFVAVDAIGLVYYFDIMSSVESPVLVDDSLCAALLASRGGASASSVLLSGPQSVDVSVSVDAGAGAGAGAGGGNAAAAVTHKIYIATTAAAGSGSGSGGGLLLRRCHEQLGSGFVAARSATSGSTAVDYRKHSAHAMQHFIEHTLAPWTSRVVQGSGRVNTIMFGGAGAGAGGASAGRK